MVVHAAPSASAPLTSVTIFFLHLRKFCLGYFSGYLQFCLCATDSCLWAYKARREHDHISIAKRIERKFYWS